MLVALALMSVSTLQAIAAVLSKENGEYPYKVIGATLLSEVFKLVVSATLLLNELSTLKDRTMALHYTRRSVIMAAVPGVAYQLLNNLNFVTLYYVDAPTFQILGNLKIVATGLAGVCLLNRHLTRAKWLALLLLTLGAATSQLKCDLQLSGRFFGYLSAIACVFLSATMGVFTEMYMKGNRASIHFQNLQLYAFGVAANALALLWRDEIGPRADTPLLHGFNFWAGVTVVTNGSCGLAVAFLLRYADSIAKTYASALAIPCTSIASYLVLGSPIGISNVLGSAIMVISLAYFYGQTSTTSEPTTALVGADDPQKKKLTTAADK